MAIKEKFAEFEAQSKHQVWDADTSIWRVTNKKKHVFWILLQAIIDLCL